jgi:hypothetical protein
LPCGGRPYGEGPDLGSLGSATTQTTAIKMKYNEIVTEGRIDSKIIKNITLLIKNKTKQKSMHIKKHTHIFSLMQWKPEKCRHPWAKPKPRCLYFRGGPYLKVRIAHRNFNLRPDKVSLLNRNPHSCRFRFAIHRFHYITLHNIFSE